VKLRGVRESDFSSLRRHRFGDFLNAVADADDGGLPGSVEKAAAILRNDPAGFSADCHGERFFEVARKEGGWVGHVGRKL
jgi:hypothetical protein